MGVLSLAIIPAGCKCSCLLLILDSGHTHTRCPSGICCGIGRREELELEHGAGILDALFAVNKALHTCVSCPIRTAPQPRALINCKLMVHRQGCNARDARTATVRRGGAPSSNSMYNAQDKQYWREENTRHEHKERQPKHATQTQRQ